MGKRLSLKDTSTHDSCVTTLYFMRLGEHLLTMIKRLFPTTDFNGKPTTDCSRLSWEPEQRLPLGTADRRGMIAPILGGRSIPRSTIPGYFGIF